MHSTNKRMMMSRFGAGEGGGDMGDSDLDEDVLGELMRDDSSHASGGNRWRRSWRHDFGETQSLPSFSPRQSPYPSPRQSPYPTPFRYHCPLPITCLPVPPSRATVRHCPCSANFVCALATSVPTLVKCCIVCVCASPR